MIVDKDEIKMLNSFGKYYEKTNADFQYNVEFYDDEIDNSGICGCFIGATRNNKTCTIFVIPNYFNIVTEDCNIFKK
jgi:hypothetical protein